MPVVHDEHSDELYPYMELRVWFGEDLKNWAEGDSQGIDVFVTSSET